MVLAQSFPPSPLIGEGSSSSGGGGRGIMAWARGVVLVRFQGGCGRRACSGTPEWRRLAPLRSLLGVEAAGAVQKCRATLDAICIPLLPPPPPAGWRGPRCRPPRKRVPRSDTD